MAVGGAKKFNEIARSPDASSHRASPVRTEIMQRLGLQTPGFWADWATRRINPYGEQTSTEQAATLPQTPNLAKITPYDSQTWESTPTTPTDLEKRKNVPMNMGGGAGAGGDTATGRTKKALQDSEKQTTWSQIRNNISMTPTLSTTVMDTMTAESINMGRQMMMYMNANPSKMLTDAAADYFMRHGPTSPIATAQTNFEKQVSLYSETKKIAEKQVGYAAAESNKKMNELIKNKKTYSSPTYMGGEMLNIGKGNGYNSMPYLSPFG